MCRPEDASRVGRVGRVSRVSVSEKRALATRVPPAARSRRKAMRARLKRAVARVDKPAGKAKTAPKRRNRFRKDAAKLRAKLTTSFLRTCTCARLMPARIRTTKKVTPTATMTIATAMLDTHAASPHPTSDGVSIWSLRPWPQQAGDVNRLHPSRAKASPVIPAKDSGRVLTEPKKATGGARKREGHGHDGQAAARGAHPQVAHAHCVSAVPRCSPIVRALQLCRRLASDRPHLTSPRALAVHSAACIPQNTCARPPTAAQAIHVLKGPGPESQERRQVGAVQRSVRTARRALARHRRSAGVLA